MIEVLDHGYVKLIESWGAGREGWSREENTPVDFEVGIIEAARQSTQGSFRGWESDEKLLRYLYAHGHMTPFEFAGLVIEVQAPIFVFREWHRHRTQSYNEMSARYEPLPDLYYEPKIERFLINQGTTNKQAMGTSAFPEDKETTAALWREAMQSIYSHAEAVYQDGLKAGIPKELARVVMPVGHYSRMRASANLRNWLQFLTLRTDENAQWEIRQYANAVATIIEEVFPRTARLWRLDNEE